ncbi:MAG: hypothetical protein OXC05_12350 [Halieaceae bacterium]|nr:hypothetical protein [Halieaceae bacterium]
MTPVEQNNPVLAIHVPRDIQKSTPSGLDSQGGKFITCIQLFLHLNALLCEQPCRALKKSLKPDSSLQGPGTLSPTFFTNSKMRFRRLMPFSQWVIKF